MLIDQARSTEALDTASLLNNTNNAHQHDGDVQKGRDTATGGLIRAIRNVQL